MRERSYPRTPLDYARDRAVTLCPCRLCGDSAAPVVLLFQDSLERFYTGVFCEGCGELQDGLNSMDPRKTQRRRQANETHRDTTRQTQLVLLRQEGRCANYAACGNSLEGGASFELDHIDRAMGDPSKDVLENKQALCIRCHSRKTIEENSGPRWRRDGRRAGIL